MTLIADVVDWEALLEVVWVSLLAGIGVTAIYSIAIVGLTRAADLSREKRPAEAVILGAVGTLAILAVAGSIVFGIVVMTTK